MVMVQTKEVIMPRGIPGSGPHAGKTKRKQVPRTPKGLKREITLLKKQLDTTEAQRDTLAVQVRQLTKPSVSDRPKFNQFTRTGGRESALVDRDARRAYGNTVFADKEAIWDLRARRNGVSRIVAALISVGADQAQGGTNDELVRVACEYYDEIEKQVDPS